MMIDVESALSAKLFILFVHYMRTVLRFMHGLCVLMLFICLCGSTVKHQHGATLT